MIVIALPLVGSTCQIGLSSFAFGFHGLPFVEEGTVDEQNRAVVHELREHEPEVVRPGWAGHELHARSPPGRGAAWAQWAGRDFLDGHGDQIDRNDFPDGVGGEEEDVAGRRQEVEILAVKADGLEELGDRNPEPAVGAVGEAVEDGVAEPPFLVDEEPGGGAGPRIALADEVLVGDDVGEGLAYYL